MLPSPPLLVLVHNCTTSLLESLEADCSAAGSEKLSVAVQAMGLDAAPPCGVTTCRPKVTGRTRVGAFPFNSRAVKVQNQIVHQRGRPKVTGADTEWGLPPLIV